MIIKQIHSINASQKPKLSTAQYERKKLFCKNSFSNILGKKYIHFHDSSNCR